MRAAVSLPRLNATRFVRVMGSGRTRPCLIAGSLADGDPDGSDQEIEVVVKFFERCDRGPSALVAEAVAALLALDLGLNAAPPFQVVIPPDLAASAQLLPGSSGTNLGSPAFGSKFFSHGFAIVSPSRPIMDLSSSAAEIFAFDMLIQNSDRRIDNPNCLCDGRRYAIIDHELAFLTDGIIGWRPPWQLGGVDKLNVAQRHLFFQALSGRQHDLGRLRTAWDGIAAERIREYFSVLPPEWAPRDQAAVRILDYLLLLATNVPEALSEVARVLT